MLSAQSLQAIDREIAKYPEGRQQSACMSALRIAQDEHGWLSPELMEFVAGYLGMPPVAVQEVATFYNMYELAPVGRHKITVCTNLSCALQGCEGIVAHLRHRLGIDFGETTADGRFTLKEGECMGACCDGPLFLINNKRMCVRVTPAEVDRILDELE